MSRLQISRRKESEGEKNHRQRGQLLHFQGQAEEAGAMVLIKRNLIEDEEKPEKDRRHQ